MSYYRQQLENWLATQDIKADRVYDVGGAQGAVQHRVKSWDVKDYEILDLPKWNLELQTNQWKNCKDADIIFCLEVFEYLINPLQALVNISALMHSNSRAYITFAFVYPHHNELAQDSLRYTQTGIIRLAEKVHLKISDIWFRSDKSGYLKQFYSADGMHPAKEYPNHDVTGFIVEFTK